VTRDLSRPLPPIHHMYPPPTPSPHEEGPYIAAWLMASTCDVTEFLLWCSWRVWCDVVASLYWVTELIILRTIAMFKTEENNKNGEIHVRGWQQKMCVLFTGDVCPLGVCSGLQMKQPRDWTTLSIVRVCTEWYFAIFCDQRGFCKGCVRRKFCVM
jgi:hypothetical protein